MLRLRAAEKPCHRQLRSELRVIAWPAPLLGEYFPPVGGLESADDKLVGLQG